MTPRKRISTLGERGNLVRLFLETRGKGKRAEQRYVVQWGPKTARQQESFPATKEGKLEAEGFLKGFNAEAKTPDEPRAPLSVRELWQEYLTAEAQHLRPNTLRLYRDAWRTFEQFITPSFIAQDLTIKQIAEYRKTLDDRGLATATVKDAIRNVRIVFNFGERMELIAKNKWHLFVHKVAKEKRTKPRAEYRAEEFLAIWAALNPERGGQWRAWVAVGLLGIYGNRQNELLNLRWSWITGDAVVIDASVVKTGEEGALTLFPLTRGILDVARRHAAGEGYTGDYVLFPGQQPNQKVGAKANPTKLEHYSIQSLTAAIHRAEKRAGIDPIKWRAGHGFRRGLVGDLIDQTGDPTLALQAIGDRDLSMLQHYQSKRRDKVDGAVQQRAGRLVPGTQGATKVQPEAEKDEAAISGGSVTPIITGA